MQPCPFVMKQLEREEIFGTPRLVEAWWGAVTTQPLAYLRHRATFMWTFLAGSNLVLTHGPAHKSFSVARDASASVHVHRRNRVRLSHARR